MRIANAIRRRQSRDAILRAAQTLFVRQGYHASSVDSIARAAGLSKGAVYFYFEGKLSILREMLTHYAERLKPLLLEMADESIDPRTRLVSCIHWISRVAATDAEAMLLPIPISIEFLDEEGPVPRLLSAHYASIHKALTKVIIDGQKQGTFLAEYDGVQFATFIVALQDGVLLEWLRRSDAIDGQALVRTLRRLILAALAPQRAPIAASMLPTRRPLGGKSTTRTNGARRQRRAAIVQ